MQRIMLDWSRPLIESAAAWLIEHRAERTNSLFNEHCVDLRSTMCVLTGGRAGRLLLAELLRQCEASNKSLLPPMIKTPGFAVDQLLQSVALDDEPVIADGWTVELAWMEALQQSDVETLQPLVAQLPERDNAPAWQRLARTIAQLHETLAGARCSFAEVAPRAEAMEMFPEGDRWHALAGSYERYISILSARGLVDPQDQREQSLQRFENDSNSSQSSAPVLIGIVEFNALQRAAFSAAGDKTSVTALVHAPEAMADRFDELGCVRAGAWDDVIIDDARAKVFIADRPMDQARRVLETLASFEGNYAADEVIIGLGDAALAGTMERSASWAGLAVHDAAGLPISHSPVFRVLKLCASWLQHEQFADFAALVRHPHIERWLNRQSKSPEADRGVDRWATLLDKYYSNHLQGRFTGEWLGDDRDQAQLARVYDGVQSLLAPLRGPLKPLMEWAAGLMNVVQELYRGVARGDDWEQVMRTRDALGEISKAAAELEASDAALQPIVDGATAVDMILSCSESGAIAQPIDENAIEMLGWLELHADPASALIIAGFNEGAIPSSITADIFLPNGLRACLGLPDNQNRYARDAYLIAAAQYSRQSLTIIAGRRAANDEPLIPSRLLLQGDDALLLKRASMLCDVSEHLRAAIPIGLAEPPEKTLFIVRDLPADFPAITSISVTDFKRYIECPYRFALSRLRLEHQVDDASELDGMQFGSMLHHVLKLFGGDPSLRDLTDATRIADVTNDLLSDCARRQFGSRPLPSVRIQIEMLRQRLHGFAAQQAQLRADGWEIRHVEFDVRENVSLDIPGQDSMPLRGRIDRIDYHSEDKKWRIIDYKSGESGKTPYQTHHGNKKPIPADDNPEWSDLQLPLYDYIIRQAGLDVDGAVELCYFLLPKHSDEVAVCSAEWQQHHLDNGIETAREIVRAIRRGEFEMNRDVKAAHDDFARLCHTEFLSAMGSDETESDE